MCECRAGRVSVLLRIERRDTKKVESVESDSGEFGV